MNNINISILTFLFLLGCKCNDKPLNDVRIRVQNDLDRKLSHISIGGTMYKSVDTFASCSMTEGFDDVEQGELTEYTTTYGSHLGYDRVRISWSDESRGGAQNATVASRDIFEAELLRNDAVEDSVANVYTGDMIYGLRLPGGDYTFRLTGFTDTSNPLVIVEIERNF